MSRSIPPESRPERRERQRFPVRLMLEVHCGRRAPQQAITRDASEAGISFFCDHAIPPGSRIEFSVHVPNDIAEQEKIFVRGRGRVVRNEKNSVGRYLVAAQTDGYSFNE